MPTGPGFAGQPPMGPSGRRPNRVWMVPVAAVTAVALMATGVWASTSMMNNLFGGAQPDTVFPEDTLFYARMDLKPSAAQLADYAQFVGTLPDSVQDEMGGGDNPAKTIVEDGFDYLDYETEVEPWLGKRFGVGLVPSSEDGADPLGIAAVAVTDEDEATPSLDRIASEEDMAYAFVDGFAVFAEGDTALNDLQTSIESASLADSEEFTSDMAAASADSSIAATWLDIGAGAKLAQEAMGGMGGSGYGEDEYGYGYDQPELPEVSDFDVSGRVASAVTINSDSVDVNSTVVDLSVGDADISGYTAEETGLTELAELPADTAAAMGGSGLDKLGTQAWEDFAAVAPDLADEAAAGFSETGFSLPGDLDKVLGTQTAFGMMGEDSADFESENFQFRAEGADQGLWSDAAESAGSGGYSTPPGVKEEDGVVVMSSGATSQGRLGDDELFTKVMPDMENASIGSYFDLRTMMEGTEEAPDPEQWGAVGMTGAFDGEQITSTLRWMPSGGR
ncbi:hypothetical protein [Nocardiopsis coralliicola]